METPEYFNSGMKVGQFEPAGMYSGFADIHPKNKHPAEITCTCLVPMVKILLVEETVYVT